MLYMKQLEKIIELVLHSAYVRNSRRLSLLVIAGVGHGKSDTILQYSENRGILVMNFLTRHGLFKKLEEDITKSKVCRHLIIPDLSQIMMGNPEYVGDTKATLMGLTEEGIEGVYSKFTYQTMAEVYGGKLQLGVLTSIAKEDYHDKRKALANVGFTSRFIPFSYSFSSEMAGDIGSNVAGGYTPESRKIKLPLEEIDVSCDKKYVMEFFPNLSKIIPDEFEETWGIADEIPDDSKERVSFRLIRQYRNLLQASALFHKREEVNDEDVQYVKGIHPWLNDKARPITEDQ